MNSALSFSTINKKEKIIMKTLGLKIVLILLCFIGISAKCTADDAYPNFEFGYQDNLFGHTYQIDYFIQNTDGTLFGPWPIGTQAFYPPNQHHYYSTGPVTIYPPTPLSQAKCYRIIVRVQRNDGETRYGISAWADLAGLGSGSLVCPVDHF